MAHRRLFKHKQRQRLSIRNVLIVSAVSTAFIAGGLAVYLFSTSTDQSNASPHDSMVMSKMKVSQPKSAFYRGSANNVILKIKITTAGATSPLKINKLIFNMRGSTKPYKNYISNARLWYTGSSYNFSPDKAVGMSVNNTQFEDGNFQFDDMQQLSKGDNYFWLTYNLTDNHINSKSLVDAELISVKIGSLTYRPDIASPAGAIELSGTDVWFAAYNGDMADINTWNSKKDGSGSSPNKLESSGAVFIIPPGRSMTNNIGASLSTVIIENESRLFSSAKLKCKEIIVKEKGILRIDKELPIGDMPAFINVNYHGTYIHNNRGVIPPTIKLSRSSVLWITKQPKASFMAGKFTTGDIIIDFIPNNAFNIHDIGHTINGSLEIKKSSKNDFIYYAGIDTLKISGDLIINGGNFSCTYGDFNSNIEVTGNLVCLQGNLVNQIIPNRKGTSSIILSGNVFVQNGKINLSKLSSIPATIFIKRGSITNWNQSNNSNIKLCNIVLEEKSTLSLTGSQLGTIPDHCKVTVKRNGYLDCKKAKIIGNGTFILSPYAHLGIGHSGGVTSTGADGNIQTLKRIYSSQATFIYNGTGAIQRTGKFSTTPEKEHLGEIKIALRNPNGMLILDQNVTLHSRVNIVSGYLVKNNFGINVLNNSVSQVK
jgi:putative BNR repeat neuraminidase